jgi:glycerol-3-phosphate dehydrogenase
LLKAKGDVGVQLYHTFGWLASDVAKGNLQRVYGSTTIAELEWIVRNELVTSVEDVLMRRTRLCFLVPKGEVLPLAGLVGKLLQRQLGWSDKKTK